MTTAPPTEPRPQRLRRVLVPAVALVLAGATMAACAQETSSSDAGFDVRTDGNTKAKTRGDDGATPPFEATADFLSEAVARSHGEPFRFQEDLSMDVLGQHIAADHLLAGEFDGDRTSLGMDLGALYKDVPGMPGALGSGDLTMDMVADGKTLYLRAPVFATLADKLGQGGDTRRLGPFAAFADLGDKWGRVDLGALGGNGALGRLMSKAGVQSADPRALLDVVKNADDPHDLGKDTVRGDPVQGLGATLTFAELLKGEGVNFDDYMASLGSSMPAGSASTLDSMRDLELPVEVWVDHDDHVRRLVLDVDVSKMLGSMPGAEDAGSIAVKTSTDYYDYGDSSIKVDVPSDAVDVTADFRSMLGG